MRTREGGGKMQMPCHTAKVELARSHALPANVRIACGKPAFGAAALRGHVGVTRSARGKVLTRMGPRPDFVPGARA